MWLFTDLGFYSAVAVDEGRDGSPWLDDSYEQGSRVMIRARDSEHLLLLIHYTELPRDTKVYETPQFDYRYRIVIEKEIFAAVMDRLTERVTYSNFKDHVAQDSPLEWSVDDYAVALHRVWYIMAKAFPASLAQWLGLA